MFRSGQIVELFIVKDNKPYKQIELKGLNGRYTYNWSNVEKGAYFFYILSDNKRQNVTYTHTAPFVKNFEAYLDETNAPRIITGFQNGIDILIEIDLNFKEFKLNKTKFTRLYFNSKKYDIESIKTLEIAGSFNSWMPDSSSIKIKSETDAEILLNLNNGYYEYKYIINGEWENGKNKGLIVGENGKLFPQGKLGTGKFSFDAIDENVEIKAISHTVNKISDKEYEFTLRAQINDVYRAYISIIQEDKVEEIIELEKFQDFTKEFDYFKRHIDFEENVKNFSIMYIIEDNGQKAYFNGRELKYENNLERIKISKDSNVDLFYIPDWTKEAIWYNIFPERFYNANSYNDPIFNEFGPESFGINKLHEHKFIEDYKWRVNNVQLSKFDRNRWTSDFSDRTGWEKIGEQGLSYSLKYARMYGGDIQGIKEKIPYMKELGINAVWLNPVFFSYQNHKYGANDFRHISPDFGTIRTSGSKHGVYISENNKSYVEVLGNDAKNNSELKLLEINLVGENQGKNGYLETQDPKTWVWTESDLIMVDLIKEFHKNGIRVIFDGVFNHSSDRHWSFNLALAQGEKSPYASWYKFINFDKYIEITKDMSEQQAYETLIHNKNNVDYVGWAGVKTLPEFDTFNVEYKEYIFNIVRKWMYGPDGVANDDYTIDDGIDGFRLDVPNCLENQDFWSEFRVVVKEAKKDAYITAEIWGNASSDVSNNKFDAVMNYEWLKTTIGYFINQSKDGGVCYKLKAQDFFNELREKRTWYPYQALQAMQNLNGSHDTDRLYSRIVNDALGRNLEEGKQLEKGYNSIRPDLASVYHPNTNIDWINSKIKPKQILKLISVFQMTYIGAPMIYYGDEVGMWGATDPYCRKPMLWDEYLYDEEKNPSYINRGEVYKQEPDLELFAWYKKIINIRLKHKVLVYGKFKELFADNDKDVLAYERYDKKTSIIIVINNSFDEQSVSFKTYHKNKEMLDLLSTNKIKTGMEGDLSIRLKAKKAAILLLKKM